MKLVNRDFTKESVKVFVTKNQIYAEIWSRSKYGKWESTTFFKSYDWEPDEELVASTVRYICRTWGLNNPVVIINN